MDQIIEASSILINEDRVLWGSQEGDPEIHTFSHDSWLSIALGSCNTVSMATVIRSMPLGPSDGVLTGLGGEQVQKNV